MKTIKSIIIANACILSCIIANAKDAMQLEIREIIIPKSTRQSSKIDTTSITSTTSLFKEIQKSHPDASMSLLISAELKNNEITQKKSGFSMRDLATGEEQLIGTELTACIVSESQSTTEVIVNLKQGKIEKFIEIKQPNTAVEIQPISSVSETISKVTIHKGAPTILCPLQLRDGSLRLIVITLSTTPENSKPRS